MTDVELARKMVEKINSEPTCKEDFTYLFNYSDPIINWSKNTDISIPSARDCFGTLDKLCLAYTTQTRAAARTVLSSDIDREIGWLYWRLLLIVLVALYVRKRSSTPFTDNTGTKKYTFDGAGPKYLSVWPGLKEISFCAWGAEYTHIRFVLTIPDSGQYSYSLHGKKLIEINTIKVKIQYDRRQITFTGTLNELTQTLLAEKAKILLSE